MDYSENIKASEAADYAYAQWYGKQSDERKAAMMESGYRFVTETIKAKAKAQNPFLTQANLVFQFVEATQRQDYSAKVLQFIQDKLADRSEAEWKQRFKAMRKHLGWSYDDIARFIGAASGAAVRASVNRKLPAMAKLAVCVFEQMKKNAVEKVEEV